MSKGKITFIGAGNMARAIIGGLLQQGHRADCITATARNEATCEAIGQSLAINTTRDNLTAIADADAIVLAVKPHQIQDVCKQIADHRPEGAAVISVAAGVTCDSMQRWLAGEQKRLAPVIRCMPNTPSQVGKGASGLYATPEVSQTDRALAESVASAVGEVVWVDQEDHMNIVTAVSGSGPAYFFLVIEAMTDAAVKMGMDAATAQKLAIQTALGAASLAQASDQDVAQLRRNVMSPNGTTERAITSFEEGGLRELFDRAMNACADRAREIAQELTR